MAEIPIEKKGGGIPWWVWLILAALVIGLLIWLFADNDDDYVQPVEPATVVTTPVVGAGGAGNMAADAGTEAAAPGGTITELSMLLGSRNDAVVGRDVRLTNVPAGAVTSDAGFWITGDDGQREYVVLNEVRTPNTPIEGRVDVDEGDRVDIVGTIRSAASGVPNGAAIPPPTQPLPEGVDHYIYAQTVTKTQR